MYLSCVKLWSHNISATGSYGRQAGWQAGWLAGRLADKIVLHKFRNFKIICVSAEIFKFLLCLTKVWYYYRRTNAF